MGQASFQDSHDSIAASEAREATIEDQQLVQTPQPMPDAVRAQDIGLPVVGTGRTNKAQSSRNRAPEPDPTESTQSRLQQAARILATGAIRAVIHQREQAEAARKAQRQCSRTSRTTDTSPSPELANAAG